MWKQFSIGKHSLQCHLLAIVVKTRSCLIYHIIRHIPTSLSSTLLSFEYVKFSWNFLSLSLSFAGHTLLKALDIRFLKDLNFNQYSAEQNEEDFKIEQLGFVDKCTLHVFHKNIISFTTRFPILGDFLHVRIIYV